MKNETMLQHLYDIQDNGVDLVKMDKWIQQFKDDIALEKCSSVTEKNMLKACKKVLKSAPLGRPVLSKTDMQEINGEIYQVMTDSYRLIALRHPLDLPKKGDDEHFPTCSRIVPTGESIATKVVTYKDMLAENKTIKKEERVKLGRFDVNGEEICFNHDFLIDAFKCLGSNELTLHFYVGSYGFKPFIATPNDNDTGFALLCPVRRYS